MGRAEGRSTGRKQGGLSPVRIIQAAQVGPDHMLEPVLGAGAIQGVIGEQCGEGAPAEDAVGDQHGALIAGVQVRQDVLRARDDDARVGVVLRKGQQNP